MGRVTEPNKALDISDAVKDVVDIIESVEDPIFQSSEATGELLNHLTPRERFNLSTYQNVNGITGRMLSGQADAGLVMEIWSANCLFLLAHAIGKRHGRVVSADSLMDHPDAFEAVQTLIAAIGTQNQLAQEADGEEKKEDETSDETLKTSTDSGSTND